MTDPIKALIAAAQNAVAVYNGNGTHREERVAIDALEAALSIAAESRPEPKPMPSESDFLPGMADRPERYLFGRPEPAAEPSAVSGIVDRAREDWRIYGERGTGFALLCDAIKTLDEALAREVRRG